MWSWSKITVDMHRLLVFQRVNHFIGNKNVSRKDFLKRNIERAQKMSAKANSTALSIAARRRGARRAAAQALLRGDVALGALGADYPPMRSQRVALGP